MMQLRFSLLLVLALGLASCDGHYVKPPPKRFQGDGLFAVETHPIEDIPRICAGGAPVGEGQVIVGCFKAGVIHMPNPNVNPLFACQVMAHEVGHALGWPANHPD